MVTDTSPDVEQLLVAMWRTAPPWQKIAMVAEATRMVARVVTADVVRHAPTANLEAQRYACAARWYGTDFLQSMGVPTPSGVAR